MKKVLLATTMLVAGASVAAAEVTLSGDARMGLINDFGSNTDTTFTSRARVSFALSGESDAGLSFGASFRADNASGAASGTAGSVFVSGAFGKLSMGDVDGAANAAVGHVDGVGLTGLGDKNENTFIANGGLGGATVFGLAGGTVPAGLTVGNLTGDPSALYEYSAGALSFYASVTLPGHTGSVIDTTDDPDSTFATFDGDAWALGAAYKMDAYKFSIGYENLEAASLTPVTNVTVKADHWIIGADGTFGAVTVKARYGKADIDTTNIGTDADLTQYALSATYSMDALSATAFLRSADNEEADGTNIVSTDAMGLGASYDLGGGAKVVGGVARTETTTGGGAAVKATAVDIGLSFSF